MLSFPRLSFALVACLLAGQGYAAKKTMRDEPIQAIERSSVKDPAKVELGKKLFFDPRLSRSGFISCNSCHNLSTGGADNLPSSIGHKWNVGPINSPTVLNAKYNLAQFWDGRAKDLQEQAGGPIANPGEMASSHALAVEVIASIPGYRDEFKKIYGSDAVVIQRVQEVIAAFEETLVTPNAPFDKWLRGDDRALSAEARQGYDLFKSKGCVGCHNGPAVGGNSFQKFGLVKERPTQNPSEGRFAVTKVESDRRVFKVPTLRNVELTYPYFHDGSVWTLDEAVRVMADVQLGQTLNDDEVSKIVAFLKSLTGEQPKMVMPILPPSTAKTPRPAVN